jgi:hypothetical protein
MWFLTLREGYKLQMSGNKIEKVVGIKKDEVIEEFRMLYNKELCDLFRSASVVGGGVLQSVQ